MFKDLSTYLNEGSFYYGLEISENRGDLNFYLLEIQRKKQELFIRREEKHSTLNDAVSNLKKNAPVFLILNTGQVLTKIVETLESVSDEALVHNAFPNLDFNAFYYELTWCKKSLLISICSKEKVNTILSQLLELDINLMDFSLGVSAITSVTEFLQKGTTRISNSNLDLSGESIERIIPISDEDNESVLEYNVNGIKVKSNFLLGFASILKHLLQTVDRTSNFTDYTNNLQREFKNKRHFTLLLRASLITILGTLLINFLFFSHYFDKVNTLQETLAAKNVNKSKLIKLKEDVKKKEERIQAILSSSNSKSSLLLDRIIKKMPHSIILTELEYQPLMKPLRDTKQVELAINEITLSGQTRESKEYYAWVESLEKLGWVQRIETTDYDYENSSTYNFSLKIQIQ
ncbi:hypothetical protein [Spongiimicrobium sp. 3-5]|uniref:hypothetical protein n=1 Tax=Spongiimicrobium sp. 3-5 TaxID=3332596 RepID=UPI00398178DC